ncbi:MAG: carbohydrate kinase family protein [Chloroflexota bacterium]|nr:MAG: carbohydrate kinase family protein [Chloroflexota bacterium]
MGAAPIGAPGWPEFAFWTPSIESVRIVLIARSSSSTEGGFIARIVPVAASGRAAGATRYHRSVAPSTSKPRVLVLGDLVLDVVLSPERPIESGTDVPGTVGIRQGGSAANTARWLARLGIDTQLVCAVGRDGAGRSLVVQAGNDGVRVRAARVAGQRTGRIGVIVAPGGERSFVADRRAALALAPDHLRPEWFAHLDLIHVPGYSLMGEPIATTARTAVRMARSGGAQVSCDLSSIGPLLAQGRRAARELIASVEPDILFATETEAQAFLGRHAADDLLEHAAIVVIKRGARGARVLAREPDGSALRFDVATAHVSTVDTTGAGDAFSAGFLAGWLTSRAAGRTIPDALHRATVAGHRAAARQLVVTKQELPPG